MDVGLRIANGVFAVMFALSVVVQLNDPDPVRWMAIYGAALAVCIAWELRRLTRPSAWTVAAVALLWAGWTAFHTHLAVPLGEALSQWDMHSGGSEEARETGGLLLVAFWTTITGWRPLHRRSRADE